MSNDKLGATFSGGEDKHETRSWGSDTPIASWAGPTPPRGMEIDVRPHPTLPDRSGETTNLTEIAARIRARETDGDATSPTGDTAEPALKASMWPDANTTGAFISAAASIRHEVRPYRWWQAAGSMILLYLCVIGIPVALIAFAVYEILNRNR